MENKKKCRACLEEKELCEFYKDSFRKDGYYSRCKKCHKEGILIDKTKSVLGVNKVCKACKTEKDISCFYNIVGGHESKCIKCHKEKKNVKKDIIFTTTEKRCPKCNTFKAFKYFNVNNKAKGNVKLTVYCKNCAKTYKITNEKTTKNKKDSYLKNKDEINKKRRLRYKEDSLYKISVFLRILVKEGLVNSKKGHTEEIIGCTFKEFRDHIEKQFLPWMNWSNHGNTCGTSPDYNCSWDLDHIIPISYAKTEEEIYMLNHWSNFQPLCSKVNRWEKKDSILACSNLNLNKTFIND